MSSQCCLLVDYATLVSWLSYSVSQSCGKYASFLKKTILWLPSVNSVDAHITNIVLTTKVQIFWVQHTQTSRCFMIQFFHHSFSISTAMNLLCSELSYHLAFNCQEYIIYISLPLLFSH